MSEKAYTTIAEIKANLPDAIEGSSLDGLIGELIIQASRMIDAATNREPGAYMADTATVRTFYGSGSKSLFIGEIAEAPAAVVCREAGGSEITLSAADYLIWPPNTFAEARPARALILRENAPLSFWPIFPGATQITAKFGYSVEPPALVKRAVTIQVIRWLRRAQQGFSDVGALSELGQLRYVSGLDPEVQLIAEKLRRISVA